MKIIVIAEDYAQFTKAEEALRILAPKGTVVSRITAPQGMHHVKHDRVICLPAWQVGFSSHELAAIDRLATANKVSMYTLTASKFQALLDEAKEVQAKRMEWIKELESWQGGDSPDP